MREEERKKERKKKVSIETAPLPQSHAQDFFIIRVRANPALRLKISRIVEKFKKNESWKEKKFILWYFFNLTDFTKLEG